MYDLSVSQACQRGLGVAVTGPIHYPPWMLSVMVPFGLLPFEVAWLLWFVVHVAVCVPALIMFSWRYFAESSGSLTRAAVISLTFVPILHAVQHGQIALLIAVVAAGSLYLMSRKRDLLAGAALSVCSIKPHLVSLLVVFLAIWIFRFGRWRVLGGAVVGFLAMNSVTLIVAPHVYGQMISSVASPLEWAGASPVTYLRVLLGNSPIVAATPIVLGAVIAMWIASRVTHEDALREMAPWLILWSLLLAPYVWVFDFSVALGAYLVSVVWLLDRSFAGRWQQTGRAIFALYLAAVVWFEYKNWVDYRIMWYLLPVAVLMWMRGRVQRDRELTL